MEVDEVKGKNFKEEILIGDMVDGKKKSKTRCSKGSRKSKSGKSCVKTKRGRTSSSKIRRS